MFGPLLLSCVREDPPASIEPPPEPATEVVSFEPAPPESPRLPPPDAPPPPADAALGLVTDRPLYRPGETVWARVFDPGGRAGAVTVALLDGRGELVTSGRWRNHGAGADVAIDLPPGAVGGVYTLRATAGSLTVDRPLVVAGFEEPRIRKELELLRDAYGPGDEVTAALTLAEAGGGPLVGAAFQVVVQVDGVALPATTATTDAQGAALVTFRLPDVLTRPDATLTVQVEHGGWTEAISRPIPVVLDGVELEWFPEGGAWVAGLPSRMYVRARGADGRPVDAAAVIEDDLGTVVARFRTVHDGLGRFELTPAPGRSYRARLVEPADGIEAPLPPALADGCALRVFDDLDGAADGVRVGAWCTDAQVVVLSGDLLGHPFAPAAVTAGPSAPAIAHLSTGTAAHDHLRGVARVRLSTPDGRPLAERLVFRNRHRALRISVVPDRTEVAPRDEVVLDVSATDADGAPVEADLAVAVVDDRLLSFADDRHGDLVTAWTLERHLSGTLEDPAWYFDPTHPDAGLGLDLVVGTFGWRRVGWTRREEGEPVGAKAPLGWVPPVLPEPELAAGLRGDVVSEVVGLGGLGSSGYGRGGGDFGALGTYARAEVANGDPVVLGSIDRSLIQRMVRRYQSQIRYCYERELARRPELQGKIVVRFVIAANGIVAASEVRTSTLGSPEVEACVAGRFLRMEFPAIPGGGQVVVNYPFVFSNPSGDAPGAYEVVREYAAPDYRGAPPPAVRSDFRSTVAWAPRVRTSVDGPVPVRVVTSDAVTTLRVTAEGLAGGAVGRTEVALASTRPFSLDLPLPVEVSFGDRLLVPVRLTNTRSDALDVALLASFGAPLVAEDGTDVQQLQLAPLERATTWIPVEVPDVRGAASVSVTASAGGLSDGIERTLTVAPRGFPAGWTASGALDDRVSERFTVDGALPGSVSAELVLYPSRLSELADGVAAMLAMPHGCFEQTSSTNYPNVLALQLLTKEGRGAALARTHADALAAGYRQLTGYQVARGGFETFGDGPGKEALSAFGLLQFHDMAQVFPDVDPQMVARDVAFLLAARDGRGGYTATGSSAHAYGSAPADLNDAYITYALARTGHLDAGAPEVRRQAALARTATDPYRLALAVLTLAAVDSGRAGDAADRLAEFQASDGSFTGADTSISVSGGFDLQVETTALAALALQRTGRAGPATDAVAWLVAARRSDGWGGTQATVLALAAITAEPSVRAPGEVVVWVDGVVAGTAGYAPDRDGPVRLDLSRWAGPGEHHVELVHDGADPVPYTVRVGWRRDVPRDDPGAPLVVSTALARDVVKLGETVRLSVDVENPTADGVPSPIARIGLPAGLRVEEWQLRALRDRGEVAFVETRPREVTLYWEALGPGERRALAFDLVAEIPGRFTAPASSVAPYYTSDARRWAEGVEVQVTP